MQTHSHDIAKALSARYEAAFQTLLADVAAASKEPDVPLVPFWRSREMRTTASSWSSAGRSTAGSANGLPVNSLTRNAAGARPSR